MNYYEGLAFFLCLAVILFVGALIGIAEKPLGLYGMIVSLLIAIAVFIKSPLDGLYCILYFAWSLFLMFFYARLREKYGRTVWIYRLFVGLAIVPLVLCKVSAVFHMGIFSFIGISYLTFRVVQIIIELYDGVIKELSFVETFAFLIFFPSFSSGPIDRSRRFHTDWTRKLSRSEYLELCGTGLWKLLLGAVYKIVIAAAAYKIMGFLETGTAVYHYIGYAYAYGMYLFFDFAGYSMMAVGSAYILGIELPDNFKMPFISLNIREFWDRWHISLSHWFRDFIFTRFIMHSTRKKWFSNRLQRACAGFFVNMGIMGIWHGITPAYILYGLYHGALLAGTEWYEKKSKFYKANKNKTGYKVCSWFITMQFVMFGFLLFSGKLI